MLPDEHDEASIFAEIQLEAVAAEKKYGPYSSTHEGYGVLAEEVAELLDAIRSNKRFSIQREAIQVAAVAFRLAVSLEAGREDFLARSGIKGA